MTTTTVTCGDQNLEHDCDVAAQTHNHGKYIFNINICGDDDCGCSGSGTGTGGDGSGTGGDGTGTGTGGDGTGTGTGGDGTGGDGSGGDGSGGDSSNTNTRLTDYFIAETGTSSYTEQFYDIAVDAEANSYAVGDMYENDKTKALIVKYDKLGSVIAQASVSLTSWEHFTTVSLGDDGYIYAAGPSNTASDPTSRLNILVVKFNAQLEVQNQILIKSTQREEVSKIVADSSGNVYLALYSQFQVGALLKEKPAITKISSDFTSSETKYISEGDDWKMHDVIITSDGNLLVSTGGYGNAAAFFLKLDSDLNVIKSNQVKGPSSSKPFASKLVEIESGRYVIALSIYNSYTHMLEVDDDFNVLNKLTLNVVQGYNSEVTGLDITADGEVILGLNNESLLLLSKDLLFKTRLSTNVDSCRKLIWDGFGRVLMVGQYNNNASLVALPDTLTISEDANALNSFKAYAYGAMILSNQATVEPLTITLVGDALFTESPTLTVETPTLPSVTNELQA